MNATKRILAAGLMASAFAAPVIAQTLSSVDDARLHGAKSDSEWITFGRDYTNQRFASQTSIDRASVAHLAPVWIYQLATVGSTQMQPVVVGGVMYVSTPGNDVVAINAATGDEVWRYHHQAQGGTPRWPVVTTGGFTGPSGPSNRGVAVAYGRVFQTTDDARVIALDQNTGKLLWDKAVESFDPSALLPKGEKKPEVSFVLRAAPLIYDGNIIVGATGFEENQFDDNFVKPSLARGTDVGTDWITANLGRRGFLSALDAASGAESWRWYTTKEHGWEGDYAAGAPDNMPLHRDIKVEKAAAKLYKNAWASGSASPWMTPAFDPATGLIFVTTGNPAPGDVDMVRPGDNLYANSVVALDAKTGALRWYFQESPHGPYDATGQAVLIDADVNGRAVPAVLNCGKSGWCFVLDRASGKLLFRSDEVVPHQNTFAAWNSNMAPSSEGIFVAPGSSGGVGVSPVSYDASTGVVYVAGIHRPNVVKLVKLPNSKGGPELSKIVNTPVPIKDGWGTLTALDLKHRGKMLWQVKTTQPLVGGTLATAGGLVFTGEPNGHFNAYDTGTGNLLWTYQTGANVGAPPISYTVNGRQFIAVATGAAVGTGASRPGGAIMVFALPP